MNDCKNCCFEKLKLLEMPCLECSVVNTIVGSSYFLHPRRAHVLLKEMKAVLHNRPLEILDGR